MASKKEYLRFKYTEEQLAATLNDVRDGILSQNAASKKYGIPKGTLNNKLRNLVPIERRMGPNPILSKEEEQLLSEWILGKAKVGFPMHPTDVQDAVQKVLVSTNRSNPFKDNRPGKKWLALFLKRRPEIARRNTEMISKARAAVTEEAILEWFNSLDKYLDEEGYKQIFENTNRVFNADELGMQFCPKTGKLLGPRKYKDFYTICSGPEKESMTVLCNFAASGLKVPPMLVVPYKRIPRDVAASIPDTYFIGRSDTGWMISEVFYEYIANCFYPWLIENILFLDGHKSHINVELFDFCKEKKILIYCLLPNATHILQPCDVSIFKPLKTAWKSVVAEHKQTTNKYVTKSNFASLFQKAFDTSINDNIIKNGFRTCGLYPLDKTAVDITNKCVSFRRKQLSQSGMQSNDDDKPCLQDFVSTIKVLNFYFEDQLGNNSNVNQENMTIADVWKFCSNKLDCQPSTKVHTANTPFSESAIERMPIEFDDLVTLYPGDTGSCNVSPKVNFDNDNEGPEVEPLLAETNDRETALPSAALNFESVTDCFIDENIEDFTTEFNFESPDDVAVNSTPKTVEHLLVSTKLPQTQVTETKELLNENHNFTIMTTEATSTNNVENSKTLLEHKTPENLGKNETGKIKILSDITITSKHKQDNTLNMWTQHLHWPKIETDKKKLKGNPMPFAIVSKQWKDYYIEKENNKKEKAEAIAKKKMERMNKSEKSKVKAPRKRQSDNCEDSCNNKDKKKKTSVHKAKDLNLNVICNTKLPDTNEKSISEDQLNIGDFVIVLYDSKYYPGKIENHCGENDEFEISTMEETSSGKWKWPLKLDQIWYKRADILQKIKKPSMLNSRGFFDVPELADYKITVPVA